MPAPWNRPDALTRNNIDALRFTLAGLVIVAHCFALPVGNDTTEPLYRFSHTQRTMGGLAVDWFFILSGFLITHSWARSSSLCSFLWKRVLRIYPAFIAASALGVYVFARIFLSAQNDEGPMPFREFALRVLTLRDISVQGVFPTNPLAGVLNGSLWSISYECWCYISVACLGLLTLLPSRTRPGRNALILAAFALALLGSIVYAWKDLHLGGKFLGRILGSPTLWARLLPCYLAGVAFYACRARIVWSPWLALAALCALIGACFVRAGFAMVGPVAGAYLLFTLAFFPTKLLSRFGAPGDFSYGLYVYAFPVQQALVATLGPHAPLWKLILLSFAGTLALAIPSWYLIEKPFLSLKSIRKSDAARG